MKLCPNFRIIWTLDANFLRGKNNQGNLYIGCWPWNKYEVVHSFLNRKWFTGIPSNNRGVKGAKPPCWGIGGNAPTRKFCDFIPKRALFGHTKQGLIKCQTFLRAQIFRPKPFSKIIYHAIRWGYVLNLSYIWT